MGPIAVDTVIDAPREEVFDFIADMANRAAFTDHFTKEFRLSRLKSTGVGAAARFRIEAPGNKLWTETVIEELERPYRILERGVWGRTGRVPIATAWELVEEPGGGTRVSLAFWSEPELAVDRLKERLGLSPWLRRQWRRALRRLRGALEEGTKVERVRAAGGNRYATGVS